MVEGTTVQCSERLEILAIPGFPMIEPGDDVPSLIASTLARANLRVQDGDVFVVTSKVVSRSQGRFVDLSEIQASPRALRLAQQTGKEPCMVELILRESSHVS